MHSGILPHHPRWAKLFENLQFVIIDELHAYRGVFGSHLTNVLRRLRRICQHYGSNPTFICSSATIANPRELAEALVERPFELVSESGAPRGEKWFLFVNPPVVNQQLGIRRSYLAETRRLAAEFLKRRLQVIVFAQSRLSTEILTTYLKDDFEGPPGTRDQIRGYRGGYLPQRRREIEKGLREGNVRAVISTNALELGIDIGALDACVMAGYPGTIAATWQRAGRAGRRTGRSAAVLVASSAPLDQFVVRNPSYFFDAAPEHALINPDNLHILVDHVRCAAFELPFTTSEQYGRHDVQEVLGVLEESGFLHRTDSGDGEGIWQWTNESYPADAVSLRSISSDNFVVVDTTNGSDVIGETSFTSGPSTLHEKAIYLVEGVLYQVERLDFEGRKAYVRRIDCDYYTDAITYSKVTVLETFASNSDVVSGFSRTGTASHGEVHVSSRVVGFKKIKFYTNENVGSGELDLPEQQMHTTAYWLTVPATVMAALPFAPDDRRDGVVGLSFAMRQIAQLLLMCDRQDIGISIGSGNEADVPDLTRTGEPVTLSDEPRIFIYDNYPGGIGFSEPLFAMDDELRRRTRELIAGCECKNGCPTCKYTAHGLEPVSRKPWSVWTRVSCGFCNIGDDWSGGNARRQRLGQRNLQHLVHRRHHVHVERVHDVLGNVGQILLVVTWQDDIRHPGAMGGEHLFLDAADRKNLAAQRDLTRHCDIPAGRDLRERRGERRGHRDAGGWSVLRDRAFGNVNVNVNLGMEVFGKIQVGGL